MLFDTHSHIQFRAFDKNREEVINNSKKADVNKIIAVGTDLISSREAVRIANQYPEVFASVGIHPHHVFGISESEIDFIISSLENLLSNKKVIAIGETGMDRHIYTKTKYDNYLISGRLINLQKKFFQKQIELAIKYDKSLIIHNRKSVSETLELLEKNWDIKLSGRSVFHFCEPDKKLLDFAKANKVFIGVDGDVLTDSLKQEFVKKIPIELIVLETDSPFISAEPKDLKQILKFLQTNLQKDSEEIIYKNSSLLFNL